MSSPGTLLGTAVVYDTAAKIGSYDEVIRAGAVKRDNVAALLNHDPSLILGRESAGTLKLRDTRDGLGVEIVLPDSELGRSVREAVSRGDVYQMSFGFVTLKDSWHEGANGRPLRVLHEVRVHDVSAVTFPAYPTTRIRLQGTKARSMPHASTARRRLALATSTMSPSERYGRRIATPSWFTKRTRERIGCACVRCLREVLAA